MAARRLNFKGFKRRKKMLQSLDSKGSNRMLGLAPSMACYIPGRVQILYAAYKPTECYSFVSAQGSSPANTSSWSSTAW